METSKVLKRGIGIALSLLFVNSVLADSASDARIQAYKANKLIPQNAVLPTSTGAADSDKVVVFDAGKLTWGSDIAACALLNALGSKYAGWSIQDIKDAMGPAGTFSWATGGWTEDGWFNNGPTPEQQELREYLSAVANGKITSDTITSAEALAELQSQFDALCDPQYQGYAEAKFRKFPCEGLDFTGRDLSYVFLLECTGITGEQIMSAGTLHAATLPAIAFTGNENFTGMDLHDTYLSKCTGITASQISSASYIYCMQITSAQYNDWKSALSSKFSGEKICVDGEYIIIP